MAIPSGQGSEVLKSFGGVIDNATFTLTAGTDEIITVLSFVSMNTESSQSKIYINWHNGSTDIWLATVFQNEQETFAWLEKIVLEPGESFKVAEINAKAVSYYGSYILQDWAA